MTVEELIPDGYILTIDFAECFNYTLDEARIILGEMIAEGTIKEQYIAINTPEEQMLIPVFEIDLPESLYPEYDKF